MLFPALFTIAVGSGMIVQWLASYMTKQIPELQDEPLRIWFHIAGELATALSLIVSGIGLLASAPWAITLFFISIGMLIYTAIVSSGYFAQKGRWGWILFFSFLLLFSIAAIFYVLRHIPI